MNIDINKPVLVSGANGYIGSWIVKKLLEKGCHVHAAVRDPDNKDRVGHLQEMLYNVPGTLTLFKTDLLKDGSYDSAMQDCELVYHTASPVVFNTQNPQQDLIDPALQGTKNILASVARTPSVKRVVLTSSIAAIYTDGASMQAQGIEKFTEEHWNTGSSLHYNAYAYSKALAEQAAWDIVQAQDKKRWDLVVINPGFVVGPTLSKKVESSLQLVKRLGDGSMKHGTLDMSLNIVSVRDVAKAHVQAGFSPSAKGRHIIVDQTYTLLELAKKLSEHFNHNYPFPKRIVPKSLAVLCAPLLGFSRRTLKNNIGYYVHFDNSYSKEALSLQYTSSLDAIKATFHQMIELGIIESKKRPAFLIQ